MHVKRSNQQNEQSLRCSLINIVINSKEAFRVSASSSDQSGLMSPDEIVGTMNALLLCSVMALRYVCLCEQLEYNFTTL